MGSILFIGLVLFGMLGAFAALAFLINGLVKKDRVSTNTGLLLLLIPGLCAGIFYWMYFLLP